MSRKLTKEGVEKGLEIAFRKLLEYKRYKKTPLIMQRNGKIVELWPDEFDITTATSEKQAP